MQINRLFKLEATEPQDSVFVDTEESDDGLVLEYTRLILAHLEHMGVDHATHVEVHCTGRAPDGFEVYRAQVQLTHWDKRAAVRLLLGFPILEHRVAKDLATNWVTEVSHFRGLWLRAGGGLQGTAALSELRHLVSEFETSDYGLINRSRYD
jgi:hypothetical protein